MGENSVLIFAGRARALFHPALFIAKAAPLPQELS
jgi:hypothetical protein